MDRGATFRHACFGAIAILVVVVAALPAPAAAVVNPTGRLPTAPTSFHTYDALVSELLDLQATHPGLLNVTEIGRSWESTQGRANRGLFAAVVRTSAAPKADVLFMGLHHGNEWISMEVTEYLLRYFLLNAGNDSRVDAILARANIWFVPVVNPDGYEYARTNDTTWRKNRHDNGDGTFGVDLNRNYGYMWGSSDFGTTTGSNEYRGIAPFSEPETQAIRNLTRAHSPSFSIAFHSAGQWILYPWSYTTLPTADDDRLTSFAGQMSEANGYQVLQEGRAAHVNPGNSDDWLYSSFGTAAFTFEVGLDFNSQNASRIGAVGRNNVEPSLRGIEMALGLRSWRIDLGSVDALAWMRVAAVGVAGSVYFVHRWRRVRRDRRTGEGLTPPLERSK